MKWALTKQEVNQIMALKNFNRLAPIKPDGKRDSAIYIAKWAVAGAGLALAVSVPAYFLQGNIGAQDLDHKAYDEVSTFESQHLDIDLPIIAGAGGLGFGLFSLAECLTPPAVRTTRRGFNFVRDLLPAGPQPSPTDIRLYQTDQAYVPAPRQG